MAFIVLFPAQGPDDFSKAPEISNFAITEQFYSHILNMNRGSFHTDELKMALRGQKVSGGFEKRAPGHHCFTLPVIRR